MGFATSIICTDLRLIHDVDTGRRVVWGCEHNGRCGDKTCLLPAQRTSITLTAYSSVRSACNVLSFTGYFGSPIALFDSLQNLSCRSFYSTINPSSRNSLLLNASRSVQQCNAASEKYYNNIRITKLFLCVQGFVVATVAV